MALGYGLRTINVHIYITYILQPKRIARAAGKEIRSFPFSCPLLTQLSRGRLSQSGLGDRPAIRVIVGLPELVFGRLSSHGRLRSPDSTTRSSSPGLTHEVTVIAPARAFCSCSSVSPISSVEAWPMSEARAVIRSVKRSSKPTSRSHLIVSREIIRHGVEFDINLPFEGRIRKIARFLFRPRRRSIWTLTRCKASFYLPFARNVRYG